jgi:hypothetical protein
MANKYYSEVSPYLVEGAKDSNYLKGSKGTYNDGKPTSLVNSYDNSSYGDASGWFEGKQGSKGRGEAS